MRDAEIRHELMSRLRAQHPDIHDTRIWPEMLLSLGDCRVDVGLVNGALSGYEIKSPRDTLARLPRQVKFYNQALDFAIIVTSGRRSERIAEHVPEWWGLCVATQAGERIYFEDMRLPAENPSVDPFHVAQLLLRDEAMDELRARGLHSGLAKATRWALWDRLAEEVPLFELRAAVRQHLKARPARAIG